jgi:hypothetical protein
LTVLEADQTAKRKLFRAVPSGKKQTLVLFAEYAQQGWQWRAYNVKDSRPLDQLTPYALRVGDRIQSGSADNLEEAKANAEVFAKKKLRPKRVRFRWEEVRMPAV